MMASTLAQMGIAKTESIESMMKAIDAAEDLPADAFDHFGALKYDFKPGVVSKDWETGNKPYDLIFQLYAGGNVRQVNRIGVDGANAQRRKTTH